MKKYLLGFVMSLFALTAFEVNAAQLETTAVTGVEKRIQDAQEKFVQTVRDFPNKTVGVVVFFTNDMPLERVYNSVQNSLLEVKGFRHGTQSYSGGYTLKPDETLVEAIENYRRDHLFFLQKRSEIDSKILASETDADLRKAITSHRNEAKQMKQDFDEKGIRVIAIELHGKAKDIQDFKKKNSFVRVVELKEKGKPQPAIIPQQ